MNNQKNSTDVDELHLGSDHISSDEDVLSLTDADENMLLKSDSESVKSLENESHQRDNIVPSDEVSAIKGIDTESVTTEKRLLETVKLLRKGKTNSAEGQPQHSVVDQSDSNEARLKARRSRVKFLLIKKRLQEQKERKAKKRERRRREREALERFHKRLTTNVSFHKFEDFDEDFPNYRKRSIPFRSRSRDVTGYRYPSRSPPHPSVEPFQFEDNHDELYARWLSQKRSGSGSPPLRIPGGIRRSRSPRHSRSPRSSQSPRRSRSPNFLQISSGLKKDSFVKESSADLEVKTYEQIMREKALRSLRAKVGEREIAKRTATKKIGSDQRQQDHLNKIDQSESDVPVIVQQQDTLEGQKVTKSDNSNEAKVTIELQDKKPDNSCDERNIHITENAVIHSSENQDVCNNNDNCNSDSVHSEEKCENDKRVDDENVKVDIDPSTEDKTVTNKIKKSKHRRERTVDPSFIRLVHNMLGLKKKHDCRKIVVDHEKRTDDKINIIGERNSKVPIEAKSSHQVAAGLIDSRTVVLLPDGDHEKTDMTKQSKKSVFSPIRPPVNVKTNIRTGLGRQVLLKESASKSKLAAENFSNNQNNSSNAVVTESNKLKLKLPTSQSTKIPDFKIKTLEEIKAEKRMRLEKLQTRQEEIISSSTPDGDANDVYCKITNVVSPKRKGTGIINKKTRSIFAASTKSILEGAQGVSRSFPKAAPFSGVSNNTCSAPRESTTFPSDKPLWADNHRHIKSTSTSAEPSGVNSTANVIEENSLIAKIRNSLPPSVYTSEPIDFFDSPISSPSSKLLSEENGEGGEEVMEEKGSKIRMSSRLVISPHNIFVSTDNHDGITTITGEKTSPTSISYISPLDREDDTKDIDSYDAQPRIFEFMKNRTPSCDDNFSTNNNDNGSFSRLSDSESLVDSRVTAEHDIVLENSDLSNQMDTRHIVASSPSLSHNVMTCEDNKDTQSKLVTMSYDNNGSNLTPNHSSFAIENDSAFMTVDDATNKSPVCDKYDSEVTTNMTNNITQNSNSSADFVHDSRLFIFPDKQTNEISTSGVPEETSGVLNKQTSNVPKETNSSTTDTRVVLSPTADNDNHKKPSLNRLGDVVTKSKVVSSLSTQGCSEINEDLPDYEDLPEISPRSEKNLLSPNRRFSTGSSNLITTSALSVVTTENLITSNNNLNTDMISLINSAIIASTSSVHSTAIADSKTRSSTSSGLNKTIKLSDSLSTYIPQERKRKKSAIAGSSGSKRTWRRKKHPARASSSNTFANASCLTTISPRDSAIKSSVAQPPLIVSHNLSDATESSSNYLDNDSSIPLVNDSQLLSKSVNTIVGGERSQEKNILSNVLVSSSGVKKIVSSTVSSSKSTFVSSDDKLFNDLESILSDISSSSDATMTKAMLQPPSSKVELNSSTNTIQTSSTVSNLESANMELSKSDRSLFDELDELLS